MIASKTFNARDMTNAFTARSGWSYEHACDDRHIARHFVAIHERLKGKSFGIDPQNMFEFWIGSAAGTLYGLHRAFDLPAISLR